MKLSRSDWIEAALSALGDEGFTAIAIEPIARRLNATRGSFYWHFTGLADLITATLERWERRDTEEVIATIETIADPREAITTLMRYATGKSAQGYDPVIRLHAVADHPLVAPVLERVTHKRVQFLSALYGRLGLDESEAHRSAQLAYALYVGTGELRRASPESLRSPAEVDVFLELATRMLVNLAETRHD